MANLSQFGEKTRKSRSLFSPSGPITARHTKGREWLLDSELEQDKPIVWCKSGPPTYESRISSVPSTRGQILPALIEPNTASKTSQAMRGLRRDINGLLDSSKDGSDGQLSAVASLLTPGAKPGGQKKAIAAPEPDDLSDDELWETIGRTSGAAVEFYWTAVGAKNVMKFDELEAGQQVRERHKEDTQVKAGQRVKEWHMQVLKCNGMWERGVKEEWVKQAAQRYKHLKFVVTATRTATASTIQLSQICFRGGGASVSTSGATATNPRGGSLQDRVQDAMKTVPRDTSKESTMNPRGRPGNAIDGMSNTNWIEAKVGDECNAKLVITFDDPVHVDEFSIVTATDNPDCDPISWRLEGSADFTRWTTLHEQTNFATPIARKTPTPWFTLSKVARSDLNRTAIGKLNARRAIEEAKMQQSPKGSSGY